MGAELILDLDPKVLYNHNTDPTGGSKFGSDILTQHPEDKKTTNHWRRKLKTMVQHLEMFLEIIFKLALLSTYLQRHNDEKASLENSIKREINDLNLSFEVKLTDMDETHQNGRIKLIEDQERDIEDLIVAQEKEIKIEEMMVLPLLNFFSMTLK